MNNDSHFVMTFTVSVGCLTEEEAREVFDTAYEALGDSLPFEYEWTVFNSKITREEED